jgi:carbon-monoxide dehydrogenase large subunit
VRRGGRRVKWIPTRAEALLGDNQGRDRNIGAEFGARRQWQVPGSALERNAQCRRAYIAAYGAIPIVFSLMPASTVHDIPAVAVTSSLVFANTAPTTPYCGAGRPAAVYIRERPVDRAAREMHIDPAELRRTNRGAPLCRCCL